MTFDIILHSCLLSLQLATSASAQEAASTQDPVRHVELTAGPVVRLEVEVAEKPNDRTACLSRGGEFFVAARKDGIAILGKNRPEVMHVVDFKSPVFGVFAADRPDVIGVLAKDGAYTVDLVNFDRVALPALPDDCSTVLPMSDGSYVTGSGFRGLRIWIGGTVTDAQSVAAHGLSWVDPGRILVVATPAGLFGESDSNDLSIWNVVRGIDGPKLTCVRRLDLPKIMPGSVDCVGKGQILVADIDIWDDDPSWAILDIHGSLKAEFSERHAIKLAKWLDGDTALIVSGSELCCVRRQGEVWVKDKDSTVVENTIVVAGVDPDRKSAFAIEGGRLHFYSVR